MTRGLSIIIYGTEGVGKTTFALQFKKELKCISLMENGFENLEMVGDVPENCDNFDVDSYPELLKEIRSAKDYSTLIIDSMSGMQQVMTNHLLETTFKQYDNPELAFSSFSTGYKQHMPLLAEQVANELTLLNKKGINTIIIGHVRNETVKNPTGQDYNAAVIDMESWPRAIFTKWASAVLYMTLDLEVMVTKTWKGKATEAKARQELEEDSDRIMYTTKNPSHSAKNLLHLPPYISLGDSPQEAYSRFISKLPPQLQEAQKQA